MPHRQGYAGTFWLLTASEGYEAILTWGAEMGGGYKGGFLTAGTMNHKLTVTR